MEVWLDPFAARSRWGYLVAILLTPNQERRSGMSSRGLQRCVILAALLIPMACGQLVRAEEESARDGVFLHVSHGVDDPQRVLMALRMAELIEMGITIFACPGCLKAAGKTPADLMPGVKVADEDAFFSFTKGRILTLDY